MCSYCLGTVTAERSGCSAFSPKLQSKATASSGGAESDDSFTVPNIHRLLLHQRAAVSVKI